VIVWMKGNCAVGLTKTHVFMIISCS